MRLPRSLLFLGVLVVSIAEAAEPSLPPKSFADLPEVHSWLSEMGTVQSDYGPQLIEVLRTWPKSLEFRGAAFPVEVVAYETLGNPFYVGAAQRMTVDASLERTQSVLDRYTDYVGIFDGLKSVVPISVDGNRVVTAWEERIPIPFVQNERNQMIYLVSTPRPGFRVYRYGLKVSNHILRSDGFIVLESAPGGKTVYTEYDFWEADMGIAKSFGPKKAWAESLEGLYQSDLALKISAEHPAWPPARVLDESKILLKKAPIEAVYENRRPFPLSKQSKGQGL